MRLVGAGREGYTPLPSARVSPMQLPDPMILAALASVLAAGPLAGQQGPFGRWDLTFHASDRPRAMWLELVAGEPVTGRLQPPGGHALEIMNVRVDGNRVSFPLPREYNQPNGRVELTVSGDGLEGVVHVDAGPTRLTGTRAPALDRPRPSSWGPEIDLLAGGIEAWTTEDPARNGWRVADGELVNAPPSSNLISKATFTDFQLHVEVNVPPRGNSGIYLRGRYEIQVQDDHGQEPHNRRMGGIYGQVTPTINPAKPAAGWQTFDITFYGRRVTVALNGVTIIDDREIPGITGGALDSDEAAPGPIMLQGDHGAIRYRNLRIREGLMR